MPEPEREAMLDDDEDDRCGHCGHPSGPHQFVRTGPTNDDGGVIVCPVKGCTCWVTWTPEWMDPESVKIPDAEHWIAILAQVQTEETGMA